ncbi:MAG: sugar nucleotide-binding protein [Rhodoluna sp.]|nr:sugar nucleotide-binding protein [Rhodoluna sp.]
MKIAITGSTGFVGSNIASVLQSSGHEVIGLVRSEAKLPWQTKLVDFTSEDSISSALEGTHAVVHCAIANDFNRLLQDRDFAYDSFVGMTSRVVKAANKAGSKPIYISTDWVMDGTTHLSLESNKGKPVNFYGFLKAMGEQVVRDLAPANGAVCRIGGVMGFHQTKSDGPRSQDVGFGYFVTSLVNSLSKGETFAVWGGDQVNKIATPSLAAEIGAQVEKVAARNATGTFHLVGDDAVTRMELAKLVCEVFNLDASLLQETNPPESELFPAPVPVDTSLSNVETKKILGIGEKSLRSLLESLRIEYQAGLPTKN